MLEKIQIIEKSTGHIAAEYPIILELVNEITEEEYCMEAWENAVDEGFVDENNRDDYEIEIVQYLTQE